MKKIIRKLLLMDKHVCPSEFYSTLDIGLRKYIHDANKMFLPYLKAGQSAADIGCGPGFFSVGLAKIVGESGKVVACDIQQSGLDILTRKIKGTPLERTISVHHSTIQSIGLIAKFDFILNFWMFHEVDDKDHFMTEIHTLMKPESFYMIVEPRFHVPRKAFQKEVEIALNAGLKPVYHPKIWMSRSVVFKLR
jgi:ubiquinone/menaquinone biosynthesis C-methylase UbiE